MSSSKSIIKVCGRTYTVTEYNYLPICDVVLSEYFQIFVKVNVTKLMGAILPNLHG